MKNLLLVFIIMASFTVVGQIQQNVNKTTGTVSQPITSIDSIRFNANQTEMEIIFSNGNIENHLILDINNVTFSGQISGEIATIECAGATINGVLTEGVVASAVSAEISYTGGNGGPHSGQLVNSTGVTGLSAELTAGSFANGNGILSYSINGTPNTNGIASFAINIGGASCTLEITVSVSNSNFTCGTSTVSFTYNGTQVTYGTVERAYGGTIGTKCWLDRNLGASQVATSNNDVDSFGDLFQWGRGDDGHEVRTSPTQATQSSTDQPGHGDFINNFNDWRNPQNTNLWQGASGINNPCPTGWRVPTEAELEAERVSWNSNNAAGAYASPLKLPSAGYRDWQLGGLFVDAFVHGGRYWSSAVNGNSSRGLYFRGASTDASVNNYNRTDGYAVRCIKD